MERHGKADECDHQKADASSFGTEHKDLLGGPAELAASFVEGTADHPVNAHVQENEYFGDFFGDNDRLCADGFEEVAVAVLGFFGDFLSLERPELRLDFFVEVGEGQFVTVLFTGVC